MKKLLLIILVSSITLCFICGCSKTEGSVEACIAPIQFESEEAFVQAVKTANENDGYNLKEITHYYRPKSVPEGAILQYIQVFETYVMLVYSLDTDRDSTDLTKRMNFLWFRTFDDPQAYIQDSISRMKEIMIELENQSKSITITAPYSFSKGKALGEEKGGATWSVSWVQGDNCFSGSVPYSLPEEDIAKYLEMEKVVIE